MNRKYVEASVPHYLGFRGEVSDSPLPHERHDSAASLLPGCFIAAICICIWHDLTAFKALSGIHEAISRSGEIASYACHALLMFSAGLVCRLEIDRAPDGWRSSGYLQWLARVVSMYWISLCLFWCLGIVTSAEMLIGIACMNELLAQDILTLWFVQVIILFLLLGPLFLQGSLTRRALGIAAFLSGLALLKLGFKWVDIRIFELLPAFLVGACFFEFGILGIILRNRWVLILALLIFPLCGLSYGKWHDSTPIASMIRMLAMGSGIVLLWRISMSVARRWIPAIIWQGGASWLGIILLHRIIAQLAAVSRLDPGFAASWLVLLGVLIPMTVVVAILFHRVFMQARPVDHKPAAAPAES
ncbi:MAG: hypothetical protein WCK77_20750 [Verrucomicrobiota bacterium]